MAVAFLQLSVATVSKTARTDRMRKIAAVKVIFVLYWKRIQKYKWFIRYINQLQIAPKVAWTHTHARQLALALNGSLSLFVIMVSMIIIDLLPVGLSRSVPILRLAMNYFVFVNHAEKDPKEPRKRRILRDSGIDNIDSIHSCTWLYFLPIIQIKYPYVLIFSPESDIFFCKSQLLLSKMAI